MNIYRQDPWRLFNQLQGELSRNYLQQDAEGSSATSDWTPPVNIVEYEDRFELFADVPGIATEDIEVTLEKGVLVISGERVVNPSDDGNLKRSECQTGSFYRRFVLPESTDPDNVNASGSNGVLKVTIPKSQPAQPRRITIN
ncbi:MAG: Hsp20/alpha crystallin family protein [Pseudomonadales bacterium]